MSDLAGEPRSAGASETAVLPSLDDSIRPRSLYVHVPFCRHRCGYCAFSVARATQPPLETWLEALRRDLEGWWGWAGWDDRLRLETIYVGGGTPSLLGGDGMERLGRLLMERFSWDPATVEWTAEANPTSLDAETIARWRDVGVSRVSIGVQAFDDQVLAWLGREHDASGARAAVRRCRAAGLDRLSLDLLFGLPREVDRQWRREVEEARDLGVGHLSLYGLTAEAGSPLGRRVELGRTRMPDDESYAEEYLAAAEILAAAGYDHYEVSNFAYPGQECRHNWCYWNGSPYLGIGPSAHSLLPPFRIWNVFRWDAYRRAARGVAATGSGGIDAGEGAASLREGWEEVAGEEAWLEWLWLGLRTRRGVPLRRPGDGRTIPLDRLERWKRAGWARGVGGSGGGRIRLTAGGWLRMDEIVTRLAGERRDA
jgi:oxygen-independent coproporphyrinogen-3 oxidase